MKILYACTLLLLCLAGCKKAIKEKHNSSTIVILAEVTPNDYTGGVSAYYEDEFGDYQTVNFQKDTTSENYFPAVIYSRHPIWLQFTRGAQVPVYLRPGDTLQVKKAPRFNVDYTFIGKRPGEINFYNQLEEKSLSMNMGDLMGLHQNETVFRPRTRLLNYKYTQRKALLHQVKDSLALNKNFMRFIGAEITGTYLIGLLTPFILPQYSQQRLRQTYLDTLTQFSASGYFNQDSLVFSSQQYRRSIIFYNRFLSKQALQQPLETEILYQNAEQKFTGQTRDYALFSLLKEKLPQDLNMQPYLNQARKDITYKPYIRYLDSLARRPETLNTQPQLLNTPVTSLAGEQLTWRDILARNKGKVVYVTFWASWFEPSLEEIQALKLLQASLPNQNIAFLYIAEDHP